MSENTTNAYSTSGQEAKLEYPYFFNNHAILIVESLNYSEMIVNVYIFSIYQCEE